MKWENLDIIFPTRVVDCDNGFMDNDIVIQNNIHLLSKTLDRDIRGMTTESVTYVWGEDGQYAECVNYNVYNDTVHPNQNCLPLNVFGQSMLNSFLYYNDIDFNQCNCGNNCKCQNDDCDCENDDCDCQGNCKCDT